MEYKYVRTGPGQSGWQMKADLYSKCPLCGFYMSLAPSESCVCPCGNMYKDAEYGRFGARTGDMTIEIYRLRKWIC